MNVDVNIHMYVYNNKYKFVFYHCVCVCVCSVTLISHSPWNMRCSPLRYTAYTHFQCAFPLCQNTYYGYKSDMICLTVIIWPAGSCHTLCGF